MRPQRLVVYLVAALLVDACGKPTSKAKLVGDVTDVTGAVVAGVQASVGAAKATTGADGRFSLSLAPVDDALLTLTKDGFVPSSQRLPLAADTESYINVVMMPLAPPQPLAAQTGGTLVGARNAALIAPPGAFVTAKGEPVTGEVLVHLTPYDPAVPTEALAYPGELVGLTADSKRVPLMTYGLLDLTVTQNGAPLQVAPGQTLTIRVPAASKGTMPAVMGMWRYDIAQALWLPLPDGVWDATTRTWTTQLGPGYPLDVTTNCDVPLEAPGCIQGIVVDTNWNPVNNAWISARADPSVIGSAQLFANDTTWNEGTFCMTVARQTPILLTVREASGRITERRFTSGDKVNQDYPRVCGSSGCMQLVPIIVGTNDPGTGEEACASVMSTNPFTGSCASELGDFYECFHTGGTCVSDIDPGIGTGAPSTELTWQNGARTTSGLDLLRGLVSKYYGPDGTLCGEVVPSGNGMTFTVKGRGAVTISTEDDGTMKMKCGGVERELNAKQTAAMLACGSTMGEDGGASCTPKFGSFTGPCGFKSDCKNGLDCCAPTSDIFNKQCMIESLCDMLCSSDLECPPYGTIPRACCLSSLGAKLCTPRTACQ